MDEALHLLEQFAAFDLDRLPPRAFFGHWCLPSLSIRDERHPAEVQRAVYFTLVADHCVVVDPVVAVPAIVVPFTLPVYFVPPTVKLIWSPRRRPSEMGALFSPMRIVPASI